MVVRQRWISAGLKQLPNLTHTRTDAHVSTDLSYANVSRRSCYPPRSPTGRVERHNLRQTRHQRQLTVKSDERNFVIRKLHQDTILNTTFYNCASSLLQPLSYSLLSVLLCNLYTCTPISCAVAFCQLSRKE